MKYEKTALARNLVGTQGLTVSISQLLGVRKVSGKHRVVSRLPDQVHVPDSCHNYDEDDGSPK